MIDKTINKIISKIDLNKSEAKSLFNTIMKGRLSDIELAAVLIALKLKGESSSEIAGAALAMRENMFKVKRPKKSMVLDTCGTGGSGKNTFNISTVVAFVVSGAGVNVAKHGNRGVSSNFGSADAIESLGININITPTQAGYILKKAGIVFLFAPIFHPAMKHAVNVRRNLKTRTIFNLLGPLCNPALADVQLIGVYAPELTELICHTLKQLKVKRAFVVHGMDGLDEVTISNRTKVSELNNKRIKTFYLSPKDFGLKKQNLKSLIVENKFQNKKAIIDCLNGKPGAKLDVVLMNAALSLVLSGVAKGFKEAVKLAYESIKGKKALKKLELLRKYSNNL
ncbi:MAG: anthranilate phosphoribosyltransferase [Candidatus Gygaella obscura]|nr:anthranilate phosphoribosyltransferase [Candidatus Gygaella obscura]